MPSLKVLWLSFNSFSKRVYALNYSPRGIDNRTRRSNYPPKRALKIFPQWGSIFLRRGSLILRRGSFILQRGSVV